MHKFGTGVAALGALLAAGCGAKWEALPEGDQRPVDGYAALMASQEDVEVRVERVKLPNDDDPDVLAFNVEVTNWRAAPIRVRLSQFALRDEEGRLTRPMDVDELKARFDLLSDEEERDVAVAPVVGATVQFADFRPFRSLRRYHDRRHCFHDRYYYGTYRYWYDPWYYPYGWNYPYGYYYGPGYGISPYEATGYELERRRELIRFLSELWETVEIEPDGVERGRVLFVFPSEPDDQVMLTLSVVSADGDADEEVASFAFRFARTR